jgi:hypothetical protein
MWNDFQEKHTPSNTGTKILRGCGKFTNQFVRHGYKGPHGPGIRRGNCGTKKDNERDYLCDNCIKILGL